LLHESADKVLVDSSVWIDHLQGKPIAARLSGLLEDNRVLIHDYVEAELRVGQIRVDRAGFLSGLRHLDRVHFNNIADTFDFIERKRLYGRGLSFVDLTLLIAAILSNSKLWTHDKNLSQISSQLGILYKS
jgi:predicted nucleic acid-binding protein